MRSASVAVGDDTNPLQRPSTAVPSRSRAYGAAAAAPASPAPPPAAGASSPSKRHSPMDAASTAARKGSATLHESAAALHGGFVTLQKLAKRHLTRKKGRKASAKIRVVRGLKRLHNVRADRSRFSASPTPAPQTLARARATTTTPTRRRSLGALARAPATRAQDQEKAIKIQTMWRGHSARRINLGTLQRFVLEGHQGGAARGGGGAPPAPPDFDDDEVNIGGLLMGLLPLSLALG